VPAAGALSSSGSGLTVSPSSGTATYSGVQYQGSVVPIYLRASTGTLDSPCQGPISISGFLASGSGNNVGGATSLSISAPAGTAVGQVLFAVVLARTAGTTVTPPAGRTQVISTASAKNLKQIVYWKAATAGEPASYSFTLSASVKASGVVVAYSGLDTSAPVELSGGQANASSTSITAPTLTPAQASSLLLGFYGIANAGVSSAPTGFASRGTDASSGNSNASNVAVMAADKPLVNSAATGTSVATGSAAGESVGQALVLKLLP
jgi:hypothetical protein